MKQSDAFVIEYQPDGKLGWIMLATDLAGGAHYRTEWGGTQSYRGGSGFSTPQNI
ncbi:MAG: hypothetical protein AAF804_01180 [Bacteroidota bacterium]